MSNESPWNDVRDLAVDDGVSPRPDNTVFVDTVRRAQGVSSFSVEPGEDLHYYGGFFMQESEMYPWAADPIQPGETAFARMLSDGVETPLDLGDPLTFEDPHIIPPDRNFELVQIWGNFEASVQVKIWGRSPDVPPENVTEQDDYEVIGPFWLGGGFNIENHERVAEPVERALFDPEFETEEPVAVSIEPATPVDEPFEGKLMMAFVQRDLSE